MINQINYLLGVSLSSRSSGKKKVETTCKGHLATGENHKFYVEHKCAYEPGGGEKSFVNSVTASYQDSLGIGTLNGHLYLIN